MAKRGSPEWKARITEGLRRHHADRRGREHLRPSQIDLWIRRGRIAPQLRPIVTVRASQAQQMAEDLGGDLTAMQQAAIEGWLQVQVAADAFFLAFAETGDVGCRAAERLSSVVSAARSMLVALGLERRAKDVIDIQGYMEAKGNGDRAPQANVGASA